ncbi:MAG: clostripain-related cysteine peptidase [Spirochaetota bacterium]
MGDPHVLASAIEFARTAYAPDRLAVVVWGPGSGYRSIGGSAPLSRATSYDEGSGGDALLTAELTTALEGDPVDVVGFDTSFAASIEVAWQIRSNARLMVASQGAADADGWPYQAILEEFAASDLSSEAFVRSVVTRLADRPGARSYDTVSAIDLSRVDELTAALDDFSGTLHAAIAGAALRDSVRATLFYEVEGFYSTPGDLAIDLGHMAEVIHREYDLADTAALALGAAVESAVALNHTGADHASATGLSVHLIPLDDEGRARATHDPAYQRGGGAADQPGFVTASAWSPQIPDGPGLLYRLFYELM